MRASTLRTGNLVTVEMQHREHRPIAGRIQKLIAVPAGRERSGFGFAVAYDATNEQFGVVESRTVRMG